MEADASAAGGSREMVEACGSRLLQLSRRTRQSPQSPKLSVRGSQTLAAGDSTSQPAERDDVGDRKSTRLNSSHTVISYAVFCLKKKRKRKKQHIDTKAV